MAQAGQTAQNLEYYPMGGGRPRTVSNYIEVVDIGNSGLDGIMFKFNNQNSYEISFKIPIDLNNGRLIKFVGVGSNDLNQNLNLYENIIWMDNGKLQFGYNMGLIPKNFNIIGSNNGAPVFDIPHVNSICPPGIPPQIAIYSTIGALEAPIEALYIPYIPVHFANISVQLLPNGSKLVEVQLLTGSSTVPIHVEVNGILQPLVDSWGIKYSQEIPVTDFDKIPKFVGLQITGVSLAPLEILST